MIGLKIFEENTPEYFKYIEDILIKTLEKYNEGDSFILREVTANIVHLYENYINNRNLPLNKKIEDDFIRIMFKRGAIELLEVVFMLTEPQAILNNLSYLDRDSCSRYLTKIRYKIRNGKIDSAIARRFLELYDPTGTDPFNANEIAARAASAILSNNDSKFPEDEINFHEVQKVETPIGKDIEKVHDDRNYNLYNNYDEKDFDDQEDIDDLLDKNMEEERYDKEINKKISSLYKYLYKMGYKKEALDLLNVIKWEIK